MADIWNPGRIKPLSKQAQIVLLAGRSNPLLATEIASLLNIALDSVVTLFHDGESHIEISHNLRRKEVYIIQSTTKGPDSSANDNILDLIFMIHAAKRASAQEITVVIPYYGYARQDRKDKPRVTIAAADIANMIVDAGADRILTVDIHSEQQEGFIDLPWDNIYASPVLLPQIQTIQTGAMVVVSPDVGGTKRAEKISKLLGLEGIIAIVHKRRPKANQSEALAVIGDVANKDILLLDDIIDTAGTIVNAAQLLKNTYKVNHIWVSATHGLFTHPALERLETSLIDGIFVTNTVDIPSTHPKIQVISVAPLLAEAIRRIHTGESISALIPA